MPTLKSETDIIYIFKTGQNAKPRRAVVWPGIQQGMWVDRAGMASVSQ